MLQSFQRTFDWWWKKRLRVGVCEQGYMKLQYDHLSQLQDEMVKTNVRQEKVWAWRFVFVGLMARWNDNPVFYSDSTYESCGAFLNYLEQNQISKTNIFCWQINYI